MDIKIPSQLDVEQSMEFAKYLHLLDVQEDVVFDYARTRSFRPFGMLVTSAKIREFCKKNKKIKISDKNYEQHTYAAHMGYFQSVFQNFGNHPGEAWGSSTYLPITILNLNEIRTEAGKKGEPIPEQIEKVCKPLADVLTQNNSKITSILTYALREIIRNTEEHSEVSQIWYASQYWLKYDLVELALYDEGIGIYQSLTKTGYYNFESEYHANLMALQPGISKAFIGKQKKMGPYDNSGYGLYMTSQLCSYSGRFVLASGNNAIILENGKIRKIPTRIKGTAIQLKLRLKSLSKIPNILTEISKKGSEFSKTNKGFQKASLSSLLQVLK